MSAARQVPELVGFQHFEIDAGVSEFCVSLLEDCGEGGDITPNFGSLPAGHMTVSYAGHEGEFLILREVRPSVISVSGFIENVGSAEVGEIRSGCAVRVRFKGTNEGWFSCYKALTLLGYVLALINEPRVVRRSASGSRPARRALQRGMGFAVDAWTRVSWDLSKATVAKISCDPAFHNVPLHWRRGHYRRALPHFNGAIQRPDALRVEDRR
ncbi:MAG: hypothetical protein ABJC93_13345, partial [Roseobacter sp.]